MIVRPYGDEAVLIEVEDPRALLGLRAGLATVPGILELVPGARTLLARYDTAVTTGEQVGDAARAAEHEPTAAAVPSRVEVAVRYDGADLAEVAAAAGCDVDALIERHSRAEYTVAFCGFSPGFAYLTGLHPSLHVPRLDSPRTSVPAGSVAIAGEYTGVYPQSSPGGWRLIGHTDDVLWDLDRTPPALLAPGTIVRFVPR